jgi:hypothetical protein
MVVLYLVRCSGLAFYHRINPDHKYTMSLWIAFSFVTAVFICQFFLILLQCVPIQKTWDLTGQLDGKCLSTHAVFITTAAMTVVCDALILIMPIILVWNLQTTRARKLELGVVLCFGVFAVVLSVPRTLSMVPATEQTDVTWYYSIVLIWSEAEVTMAIVALSLPALKSFFTYFYRTYSTTYSKSSKSASRDVNLRTIGSGGADGIYRGPRRYDGAAEIGRGGDDDDSERSLVENSATIAVKHTVDIDVNHIGSTPRRH